MLDKTSRLWYMTEILHSDASPATARQYRFECIRILYGINVILTAMFCPMNTNMFAQVSYTIKGTGMIKVCCICSVAMHMLVF